MVSSTSSRPSEQELIGALLVLGRVDLAVLQRHARELLADGADDPALEEVAWQPDLTLEESRGLYARFLAQENKSLPNPDNALHIAALDVARRILCEEVAPVEGAKIIWDYSLSLDGSPSDEISPFVYLGSEASDRPDELLWFESEIRSAAADILHSSDPSMIVPEGKQ